MLRVEPAPLSGGPVRVRSMTWEDVPEVERVAAAAFGFEIENEHDARRWRGRLTHLLETDPEGAFVAHAGGRIVGVAQVALRDRLWCLSLLTVDPAGQSAGAGGALLQRALAYGADRPAGLIVGSNDYRGLRLYARAGFSPRPTLEAVGVADRGAVRARHRGVRIGGERDLRALVGLSRAVRGGPYTSELRFALERGAELLVLEERGFAVAQEGHGVWLLVAGDENAAETLLWAALEVAGEAERPLRWITAEQQWAIRVAVAAGLGLRAYGALCVRGAPGTLCPFLPSSPFA